MWDNREFRMELREGSILDYEKIMLSSGQCTFFIPMGFMGDSEGEFVCYQCSGFAPLSKYRIEKTDDALYLLERTLIILGRAVEYLITPSKIKLCEDTVFYNRESGEVKIAYMPLEDDEMYLRNTLTLFIRELGRDIEDGYEGYLDEMARSIYYNNYYIRDMVNRTGLMRRKLFEETRRKN